MVLMSSSLCGDSVVPRSNILTIDDWDGEISRCSGQLALLVELCLGRVGVQDGSNGLSIDHGCGEVCGSLSTTEGVVRAGSSRETSRQDSLGASSGYAKQSS